MFGDKTKKFEKYKLHTAMPEEPAADMRVFEAAPDAALPPAVDLRPDLGPVDNTGQTYCSSAAVVCACVDRILKKRNNSYTRASRLFVHYNARRLGGNEARTITPSLQMCIGSLVSEGFVSDADWPLDAAKVNDKPPQAVYGKASLLIDYEWGQTRSPEAVKAALADGYPVAFRYSGPEAEFRAAAKTGKMEPWGTKPAPELNKFAHIMLVVGYDDAAQTWMVRNVWGEEWGDKGHLTVPYDTMKACTLTHDFFYVGDQQTPKRALMSASADALSASSDAADADAERMAGLAGTRKKLRDELADHLDDTKKSTRDRLRQMLDKPPGGDNKN